QGSMEAVGSGFENVVFGALAIEFHGLPAGFDLKLFYRFDGDSQSHVPAFALLYRIRHGNAFYVHFFREALASVDLAPSICVGHAGKQVNERSGISWTCADSADAHCKRKIGVDLVTHGAAESCILSAENRRLRIYRDGLGRGTDLQIYVQTHGAERVHDDVL